MQELLSSSLSQTQEHDGISCANRAAVVLIRRLSGRLCTHTHTVRGCCTSRRRRERAKCWCRIIFLDAKIYYYYVCTPVVRRKLLRFNQLAKQISSSVYGYNRWNRLLPLSLSLLLIRRMGTPNQSTPLFIPLPIDPCTEWILFCNTTFLAPRYRRRRRKKEKKRRRSWISYSAAVYYISLLLLLFFFFVPDLFIMAWVNIDEGGPNNFWPDH